MCDLFVLPDQTERVFKALYFLHEWNEPKDYEAFRVANPQHDLPDMETVLTAFEDHRWNW